ncbi:hypothetical protein [Candidatus Contubernalis alkaliaceticus]|uniref:hypothetical protein n=1 Tax=Candidatus Contubernalis alkaliaceticus TaxID=338645 RepID=UPI001F4C41B5|nr:hypothetical protein [Candidatus Contubernalis alkalaceticus]UNC93019.1 hypothetical protein HUE98_13510 [Candidatus Contubernalis alkalaceticus]
MKWLEKIGFYNLNTADEMDIHISYLAARNLAGLVWIFLLIWIWYDFIKTETIGTPFLLAALSKLVYFGSIIYYRKKFVGNSEQ